MLIGEYIYLKGNSVHYLFTNPRANSGGLSGLEPSTKSAGWRQISLPQGSVLCVHHAEERVELVLERERDQTTAGSKVASHSSQ